MNKKVREVVEFMQDNLSSKLSLKQIALAAKLSERQIGKLFHSAFRMPPYSYLKEIRLQKATELLRKTDLSVKEIRAGVGYGDASDFTRDFKRKYGLTPTHYRRQTHSLNGLDNSSLPPISNFDQHNGGFD